jgi:uncharacterized membrane protein YdjX (TVP38/TMEM64 family)
MAEIPRRGAKRGFAMAAAVVLGVSLLVSVGTSSWIGPLVTQSIDRVASHGWYGQCLFLSALVAVCLTGIIPASMLAMAAGTLYGFVRGSLLSAVGLSLGGLIGFLAARYLFRDLVGAWVRRRMALRRIDADIVRQGWRIVALLRLSPVAPFGITSYAFGLTRLGLADYLLGTIGSLPAMTAYVYMGVLARAALHASSHLLVSWVRIGVLGLGVAATLIAAVHFYRVLNGIGRDPQPDVDPS